MNLTQLKSICEAATPAKHWAELHTVEADDAEEETVLKFIATFNPVTIAKILAVVEAANVVVENYSWANLCSLGETLDAIKEERNENERRDSCTSRAT